MMDKFPPMEKIYEAYSAIADQRVALEEDHAKVLSSDRKKCYTIAFEGNTYSSNDNSTYWQGYAGYPVIAVLLLQGKLPLNRKTAELFKDINWNLLNKKYKRDYKAAAAAVMNEHGMDMEKINEETLKVYDDLQKLDIVIKRGRTAPGK